MHLLNTPEAQLAKIQLAKIQLAKIKYINDPDGLVFRNVVIQRFGKQHAQVAVFRNA